MRWHVLSTKDLDQFIDHWEEFGKRPDLPRRRLPAPPKPPKLFSKKRRKMEQEEKVQRIREKFEAGKTECTYSIDTGQDRRGKIEGQDT